MGYPLTVNMRIEQGATFRDIRRWGVAPFVFKAISGATQTAPLVLQVADHAMPDGWYFAIEDVKGMLRINSRKNPPAVGDYVKGSVVSVDSIKVPSINALDFSAYESGGVIRYATPVDLSVYTNAVLTIHEKDDIDNVLAVRTLGDGIELDNVDKRIITSIEASATALLDWDCEAQYTYDLFSAGGEVKRLFRGDVYLVKK